MPQVSYINRQNTISIALDKLNNYPVGSKQPSLNSVANEFGLAEAMLRRVAKNDGPLGCPRPSTIFTKQEEDQLAGYCINIQKLGFDHTELSICTPQELTEAHAQQANATIINDHFEKLQKIVHENSLTAVQIWNMDETGFILVPKSRKVIARKDACQVHKVLHRNSHEHIFLVLTISAVRAYIPPLIIYKGVHAILGLLEGAPSGTVIGFTKTEYMHEDLFQMYLEHFISLISPIRLVLLMLDGHKSHINYTSTDFCHRNRIMLYALPPYTTYVLQPSELLFVKLKEKYSKMSNKYTKNNDGMIVMKHIFVKVLGPVFFETYTPLAICNAYRKTGIWPLNSNANDPNLLAPSLSTECFINPNPSLASQPICSHLSIHFHPTWLNVTKLVEKNALLKDENESLKTQIALISEELDTYKNPGICFLCSIFKYSTFHNSQASSFQVTSENQSDLSSYKKKRKTLPFAQLLTNEKSLQELKEVNKEAEQKSAKSK
ncbi:12186_t:CDS:2 [Cetraspora pellucida]|uniref:12186_t:CDS:1 n=1 Tax=Cetraspora pellucida TaxID=1433469 RepID=A0A9N9AFF2_9GLOM|nr:12186_t:CDS:2 [Cetraspora pellucida]